MSDSLGLLEPQGGTLETSDRDDRKGAKIKTQKLP